MGRAPAYLIKDHVNFLHPYFTTQCIFIDNNKFGNGKFQIEYCRNIYSCFKIFYFLSIYDLLSAIVTNKYFSLIDIYIPC